MLHRAQSERSARRGGSSENATKLHSRPYSHSFDSVAVHNDAPEAVATTSPDQSDSVDSLVASALAAMRVGPRPSVVGAENAASENAKATSLVVGKKVGAGMNGELFETNVEGFLLKVSSGEDNWTPEDICGGEVEAFEAIYGEGAAQRIDENSFLIRRFPGVDIDEVCSQLNADDAHNLLRKVTEMHNKGIYHGDIAFEGIALVKNVLFDPASREFYIIDFGSSRLFTEAAMARQDIKDLIAYEFRNVKESIDFLTRQSN